VKEASVEHRHRAVKIAVRHPQSRHLRTKQEKDDAEQFGHSPPSLLETGLHGSSIMQNRQGWRGVVAKKLDFLPESRSRENNVTWLKSAGQEHIGKTMSWTQLSMIIFQCLSSNCQESNSPSPNIVLL
jgi:hypothetical protein